MKKFLLTVIVENQKSLEKAHKIGQLINETLKWSNKYQITRYEKLNNSYKLEFAEFFEGTDSIRNTIELMDRICSPWIVIFNREENEIELFFNKEKTSKFRKDQFNVIKWANFEVENK